MKQHFTFVTDVTEEQLASCKPNPLPDVEVASALHEEESQCEEMPAIALRRPSLLPLDLGVSGSQDFKLGLNYDPGLLGSAACR